MSKFLRAFFLVFCGLLAVRPAAAYSLLTHEQLIDLTWNSSIVPLLLSRYPNLTPAEIEHARAYAYGGCVIQDIGYYPFGDIFYSDLTHYVRSGDFVVNLFRDAQNADQLAFAVGALSHYIGDSIGHSEATNLSVPVEFPKLRDKYGRVVTYADGEHQHVQTEFAYDINEIAQHRLAPVHYLRQVGLEVPLPQLELAFYQTYGLHEHFSSTRHSRINVGAYRFAVHRMIPRIAYALTLLHRHGEPSDPTPADASYADLKKLEQQVAAVEQENHWDAYRRHAGIGTYALAGFIFILPKVGPLKLLAIKGPTARTEAEYVHSVLVSSSDLDTALRRFTPPAQRSPTTAVVTPATPAPPSAAPEIALPSPTLPLPKPVTDPDHPLRDLDLDTGFPTRPAGYPLTDATYATLAHRLAAAPTVPIPPGVKIDILAYYANLDLPFATKQDPAAWATLQADLAILRSMRTTAQPVPFPTYESGDGVRRDSGIPSQPAPPASGHTQGS